MAEAATQTPQAPAKEAGQPQGSFLDPDVILVLFVAIVIDILDVVLAIGVIANLILGGFLILWMTWKTGSLEKAREQTQNIRQSPQATQAARKKATGRALKRGILFFLGGLVPILSVFMLWTWAVINTVRGK